MGILDFKDIAAPTISKKEIVKGATASHLDDFEKFAQDFFQSIYGASIIEVVSRGGGDKGRDLVLAVSIHEKKEIWLVSCKHKAHSGRAVYERDEDSILNRYDRFKCDRFVGFYSHIASTGLRLLLEDFERMYKRFKFRIFNNVDIERELLSSENAKGWFLAARHFPNSYIRLFKRFLSPIEHYKLADVEQEENCTLRLKGPGGQRSQFNGTEEDRAARVELMVRHANESLTFAVHESFFAEVLNAVTRRWPNCFAYWSIDKLDSLRSNEILPTFNSRDLVDLRNSSDVGSPIIVAALWAWWDFDKAVNAFLEYRQITGTKIDYVTAVRILSIPRVTKICSLEERDILTRFIAFSNVTNGGKNHWGRLISAVKYCNRYPDLQVIIQEYKVRLSHFDLAKVERYGSDDIQTLTELANLGNDQDLRNALLKLDPKVGNDYYSSFNSIAVLHAAWNIIPSSDFEWWVNNTPGLKIYLES